MSEKILYNLLILVILISFSCEKHIELHPENSEEKVMVEAMFTNLPFVSSIKLSKTKDINEDILNHPKITDADVHILDLTTNDTIFFTSHNDGSYTTNVSGIPGHRYRLEINTENQLITSEKLMLHSVSLNQVKSHPKERTNQYYLEMVFDDDPNTQDFYLFTATNINNPNDTRIFVLSDLEYNFQTHSISVSDELFNFGENWQIIMLHLDRENYEYFKILNRARNSLLHGGHPFYGLSLGNPVSTVHGKKTMGYFVTSSVSISPIVIGN